MKLIVGLGNPGKEYGLTRHNVGFLVIDQLAKALKCEPARERKLKAELAILVHDGQTLILAKPQTFMNLSGQSVAKIASYYKIPPSDIWVISDDFNLNFGALRIRTGGTSGGHNGLKDIIEKIGSDFVRFRVGIKNPTFEDSKAEKFVLQQFNIQETEELPTILQKASELILGKLKEDIENSSHFIKS